VKTIIGETAIPDGLELPPSWPHTVLQAVVAMRAAYAKAGRAGGPSLADLERLEDNLALAVVGRNGPSNRERLIDPFESLEDAVRRGEVVIEAGGAPLKPMTPAARKMYEDAGLLRPVSESTRSALDELPTHDALHDHLPGPCEIASGRWDATDKENGS
jgi:hypothetical protein